MTIIIILLNYFFFLGSSDIIIKSEKQVLFDDIIKDKKIESIKDFSLIYLNNPPSIYIYTIIYNKSKNKSKLVIESIFDKNKYIYSLPNEIYVSNTFQYGSTLYIFSTKLYSIDLKSFELDTINLSRNQYKVINIQEFDNKKILVASYNEGVDIYSYPQLILLTNIKRNHEVQYDRPIVRNGILFYKTRNNVLAAYNLKNKHTVWYYDFGKSNVYWLGIKVGTYDNYINEYKINNNFLFVSAGVGNLIKLRIEDGKPIIKKEQFKGKENNAGLITNFEFYDINDDGIEDLIAPAVDYNIYCLNGQTLDIIWEYDTGFENQMPVSLFDITGDRVPEIFAVNDEMKLSIIDGKRGKLIEEVIVVEGVKNGSIQSEVFLADVDGDSTLNVIVKGGRDRLKIYEIPNVKVKAFSVIYNPEL
ncbi:MAG: hypothetical protein QHH13_00910 [Melioribacter sp.]|uniref:hypothetical protein n=1 Tax=Rosettibacter primus TaxID=3111523 RepID=UPI00247CDA56|nr:hypothetical protein [Melioribacter sp.]